MADPLRFHPAVADEATRRVPFSPFTIRLADGRSLRVPHPDFVAISRRLALVVDAEDDHIEWVEPLLIVSLDFDPEDVADQDAS